MQPKKNKAGLIIGLVLGIPASLVAMFFVITTLLGVVTTGLLGAVFSHSVSDNSRAVASINSDNYVGVLHISGIISDDDGSSYNQRFLLEQIEHMLRDPHNAGLLLLVDSPGGSVYHSDELYLKLREYKAAKPIYSYLDSIAASGGYYVGCVGQDIMINRNGLTGSIGVISDTVYDLSGFLESHGIKATVMHAGANKGMGDYTQPFTEEQKAIYQSVLDEAYDQFVEIVSHERSMTVEAVRQLADGRVYTPKQALANGLVDTIGTYDQYETYVEQDIGTELDFEHIFYRHTFRLEDVFSQLSAISGGEVNAVLQQVQGNRKGLQYLYQQ